MKSFPSFTLVMFLLISVISQAKGSGPGFDNPLYSLSETNLKINAEIIAGSFVKKPAAETTLGNVKKILTGLTKVKLGENAVLKLITPGPFAKQRIDRGVYPECFPARYSFKIYFSF